MATGRVGEMFWSAVILADTSGSCAIVGDNPMCSRIKPHDNSMISFLCYNKVLSEHLTEP